MIIAPRADAAFIIRQAQWCTLDYLTIHTIAGTTSGPAIRLGNSVGTTIERVIIAPPGEGNGPAAGILLEPGFLLLTKIRDNFFHAQSGVSIHARSRRRTARLLLVLFIASITCCNAADSGIELGGSSYYTADTVLARNFIFGTEDRWHFGDRSCISGTGNHREYDHARKRRWHRCRHRRSSHRR